jgi:hypothetical protein
MGLLDNLFSDDPKQQALMAMAFGLLGGAPGGRKNFGADVRNAGLLGMQTADNAQMMKMKMASDERANRANDLQQLQGISTMLRQQDAMKAAEADAKGLPIPPPNPALAQIEQRMAGMFNESNLTGGTRQALQMPMQATPQQSLPTPQPPPPQAPPQAPSGPQMSTPQNPQFQVPPAPGEQASRQKVYPDAGGISYYRWVSTDPVNGPMKYLEQLAKDRAPQNVRPGGSLAVLGPDGQYQAAFYSPQLGPGIMPQRDGKGNLSASQIPGFVSAATGIKGAETSAVEAAKFPYSEITTASGAKMPAFMAGVTPPGSAPSAPPQTSPRVASLEVTQPSQNATSQQSDPWATMPKRATPQGMGQTTFDKTMAEQQGGVATKLVEKYGAVADAANQRIALNNQALALVDKADTGPKAALIGDVKNWLVSRFNVPESSFENTPSATIALQKDLLNAATQRAKQQFGSRITQSEVMLMLSRGSPNVDMPKAAIKYLIDSDNAMSKYGIQQSADLGRYLQQGGDPMRFEGWHAQAFPAAHVLGDVKLNVSSGSRNAPIRKFNPATGKIE